MSRPEKTRIAGKRQAHIVPTEQSTDTRAQAKHPIAQRGAFAPLRRKRGGRKPAR